MTSATPHDFSSRFNNETVESRLSSAAISILSIPQTLNCIGLYIQPGFERHHCFKTGAELWNTGGSTTLLIAGQNKNESVEHIYTTVSFHETFGAQIRTGRIFSQGEAYNTKEQAVWLVQMVQQLRLPSVGIIAPAFHMTRAYLTILAQCEKQGVRIPLIPLPTKMSYMKKIPLPEANQWELTSAELQRITRYQETGDVASFEKLQEYLVWLWDQPILN